MVIIRETLTSKHILNYAGVVRTPGKILDYLKGLTEPPQQKLPQLC